MDYIVAEIGAQVAERFPSFDEAGLASSWTGVYDVTPDWNPVLGRVPGLQGLVVGYGFSGHGFKLSPAWAACWRRRRSACPPTSRWPRM
jgi:sarcosine oxidase subunit beta